MPAFHTFVSGSRTKDFEVRIPDYSREHTIAFLVLGDVRTYFMELARDVCT